MGTSPRDLPTEEVSLSFLTQSTCFPEHVWLTSLTGDTEAHAFAYWSDDHAGTAELLDFSAEQLSMDVEEDGAITLAQPSRPQRAACVGPYFTKAARREQMSVLLRIGDWGFGFNDFSVTGWIKPGPTFGTGDKRNALCLSCADPFLTVATETHLLGIPSSLVPPSPHRAAGRWTD
eukprot:SAG11_NODE_3038_length_2742_cov_5.013243_2_plen_176_part_00